MYTFSMVRVDHTVFQFVHELLILIQFEITHFLHQTLQISHTYSAYTSAMYMYMNTQTLRNKERQSARPETTFSSIKTALRWDSNPRLTHSRHAAPPTELLRCFVFHMSLIWYEMPKAIIFLRWSSSCLVYQVSYRGVY